jgi:SPP1 gp7 family putative phage head morphogenesis protein
MTVWSRLKNILFYGVESFDSLDKELPVTEKAVNDNSFFMSLHQEMQLTNKEILADPYTNHDLIFSMCRNINVNLARVKLTFKNTAGEVVENHPIIDLFNDPNPMFTKSELMEKIVLGLLLPSGSGKQDHGGQVFIVGQDLSGKYVDFTTGKIPKTLTVLYEKGADYIIEPNASGGFFKGWDYKVNGAVKHCFTPSEVIRIRFIQPKNDYKGLSYTTPAQRKLFQDIASDEYNTSFFENGATLGGFLTPKDPSVSQDQMKKALLSFYEQHQGYGKQHKIGALSAMVDFKELSAKHRDMEFTEQKKYVNDSLISTYGQNKIALGRYEDVNYATIQYGHKMLWNDEYIPILNKIIEALQTRWIKYLGLTLVADYSDIEALEKDYTNKATAFSTFVNASVPPVLAAKWCNIPLTEEEIQEYPHLKDKPKNVFDSFTEDTTSGETEAEENKDEEDTTEDKEKKAVSKKKAYKGKLTQKEQFAFCKSYYENITKKNENTLSIILAKILKAQEKEMLDKLPMVINEGKSIICKATKLSKLDIDKILFDLRFWDTQFKQYYKKLIPTIMKSEANQLRKETNGIVNWNYTNENLKQFIKQRNKVLSEITVTTFDKVKTKLYKIIEEGKLDNLTTVELAAEIRKEIGVAIEARGGNIETIARTEVTSIQTYARVAAFEESDIEWVEWSAAEDDKTRESHIINGKSAPVKLGEEFPAGGLRYPHDPNGSPEEVINCRCVLIASEKNLE